MRRTIQGRAGVTFAIAISLIVGFLQSPASSRADEASAKPRTDGVYQFEKHVTKNGKEYNTHYFLRFYADGAVISYASVNLTAAEFWERFNPKSDDISKGTYTVNDGKIAFTTESKFGKIDYAGKAKGDQLEFHSHSQVNQHDRDETYTFVKIEGK